MADRSQSVKTQKAAKKAKDQGNKAYKKGNFLLAIKHFTSAIALSPENKTFYSNRAAAYTALGKHDPEALEKGLVDALKCIDLDPDWGKGYNRHGAVLFTRGDYAGAVKVYAQGLAIDPSNANLTQGLQAAQAQIKKQQNAERKKKAQKEPRIETKEEEYVVGIDLGTTYSCVAVWRNDGVEIIPNDMGDRTTPSYVGWTKSGDRLIGQAAKNIASSNPQNVVYDIKRVIGQRFSDPGVEQDARHFAFEVVAGGDDKPTVVVDIGGRKTRFVPEQISSMVLGYLKNVAEKYLGGPVRKAVITVPAYFNDAQRTATKAAGKIAGLEVLRIINEPTAAALSYGLDHDNDSPVNVMVFDLGGGTFDVSLLHISGGIFEVKATGGDTRLGGEDFDQNLVEFLAKEVERKGLGDISKNDRALRRLRSAAERAKRTISSSQFADIDVDALVDGEDFNFRLTRANFERINRAPFLRCMETVQRVLKDAKLKPPDVSEIVLVGGSTRIPRLQEMLQEHFGGKELCKTLNPDEAVAYGAAVQAGILAGKRSEATQDLLLMDVVPLSLGIETTGRVMSVIIPRNSHIPCKKTQTYTTEENYQRQVDVCVYEGERLKTDHNNLLGKFTISDIERAKRGEPQIDVSFEIDADGILTVTAVDQVTNSKANIQIANRQDTSPEEIERMIDEAKRFNEQDKSKLERAHACNDLEQTIFKVLEVAKKSEGKIRDVLEQAAFRTQDWLDAHGETSSVMEIEKQERVLGRRIQQRSED